MFDIVLGIFLFLSPVFTDFFKSNTLAMLQFYQFGFLGNNIGIMQLQFFEYGIVLLFIIALMQKPLRNFKDKYIGWFSGLCVLSVVFHPKTLIAFIPVFLGVLLYYLAVSYAKNIKRLLYVIVLISALNTLFAALQFFNIYWLYKPSGSIYGLMLSASHLGIYQALAFPICYFINPFLSLIPLVGLLLSKSITPFIALLVGMAYLWFPKRKKIIINLASTGLTALLGIFIILIAKNYHNVIYKLGLKFGVWFATLKQIFTKPLGFGLGTFSKLSPKFYSKLGGWEWAYNEYLEIAFCIGLAVWFIMGLFLIDKFNDTGIGLKRAVAASCLIIAVVCLGQSPLHFPRLTGTIIPLFAFLEILRRKEFCDEN